MIDKKVIDLAIRARLEGKQNITDVAKSISELDRTIESQIDAAKRGESSIDGMKASLLALQQVQSQLKGEAELVGTFQKMGTAIGKASEAVDRTKKKYTEYEEKLRSVGNVTDAQQAQLIKLSLAYERAQNSLSSQKARYAELADVLKISVTDTDGLVQAELRLRDAAAQTGITLANLESAIKSYSDDIRRAKAIEDEFAQAQSLNKKHEDAKKLQAAAEYINFWTQALEKADRAQREFAEYESIGQKEQEAKSRQAVETEALEKKHQDAKKLQADAEYINFWTQALEKADRAQREFAEYEAFEKKDQEAIKRQAAEIEAFEKKIQDAKKLQAAAEYINFWTQALEKADQAQREFAEYEAFEQKDQEAKRRQAADAEAFEKKHQDAKKLQADAEYVNFWTQAIDRADAAEKTLSQNKALSTVADDADRAAKGYTSLARASSDLTPKTQSLRAAIDGIIDPSRAAKTTLTGIEQQVNQLSAAVGKIKGPIKDYNEQLRSLTTVSKSIGEQAGLIDSYNQQVTALRVARAEFTQARSKVTEYANAVRQGGESGAAFTKSLADAQNKLRNVTTALQSQLVTTRQSREALREAGVATNNLAGAQQRLTTAARTNVVTITSLAAAYKRYGQQAASTGKSLALFESNGRTTLSLMQRIRGEVLALTASYVGLQAVVRLAASSIELFSKRQGIRNQLGISVGNDKKLIDEEYEYVKRQSQRIGLEFENAVAGFSKFSAAASMAGRSRKEIRYIWETFAEVGRVANLTTEQMDGVFKALEQITSKGKIMSEELRLQLGDRLFGAFQVAAQALKDEFPNLDKAMKKGEVTSEQLIKIAQKYRQIVSDQLPEAVKSLAAEQARFKNQVFDFKLMIADTSWADAYTKLLKRLTSFMAGEEGIAFAKTLGESFSKVADSLLWVINNLDLVQSALKVVLYYFGVITLFSTGRSIVKIGKDIYDLSKAMWDFKSKIVDAMLEFPKLAAAGKMAVGALTAAFVGWQIGTWLSNEFAVARKAGVYFVTAVAEMIARVKSELQQFKEDMTSGDPRSVLKRTIPGAGVIDKILEFGSKSSDKERADALKKSRELLFGKESDKVNLIKEKLESDLKAIGELRSEMLKEAEKPIVPEGAKKPYELEGAPQFLQSTPFPGISKGADVTDEAGLKKRERAIEAIRRSLEALDAKIDKAKTETLATQLGAIDVEYAALSRKIAKLGGIEGEQFAKNLADSTSALRKQVIKKFNDELLKEQEQLQGKLESIEVTAGRKEKRSLEGRLDAIRKSYQDTYRDIESYREKLEQNKMDVGVTDAMKVRLDAGIVELQQLETRKFNTEQMTKLENVMNVQLGLRAQKIKTINTEYDAGLISEKDKIDSLNRITTDTIPTIIKAAQATKEWATANMAVFDTIEEQETFISKMDEIIAQAKAAKTEFTSIETLIYDSFGNVGTSFVDGFSESVSGLIDGTLSLRDALDSARYAVGTMFAEALKGIAQLIAKQLVLNAILAVSKALGWTGLTNIVSPLASKATVFHGGGTVGSIANRSRSVASDWFANAPRYHSGGGAGLAPNEYATILEKGEEVLSKSSPRNILNGASTASSVQSQQQPTNLTINNLFKSKDVLEEALSTGSGRQILTNAIGRERSSIKKLIGAT